MHRGIVQLPVSLYLAINVKQGASIILLTTEQTIMIDTLLDCRKGVLGKGVNVQRIVTELLCIVYYLMLTHIDRRRRSLARRRARGQSNLRFCVVLKTLPTSSY